MSTKLAFLCGFIMAKVFLACWFSVWLLHGPEAASTALFGMFVGINTVLVSFVTRALANSPVGKVPVLKALNGGGTQYFVEHPEHIPQTVQDAVTAHALAGGKEEQ